MIDDFVTRTLKTSTDELTRTIELCSKVALALIGLSYAIGLIIVNLYLSRFGVFTASLFRVDYVLAGGLWLLLFGIGTLLQAYVRHRVGIFYQRWAARQRVRAVVALLTGLGIAVVAGTAVVQHFMSSFDPSSQRDWAAVGISLLTPAIVLNLIDAIAGRHPFSRNNPTSLGATTPFYGRRAGCHDPYVDRRLRAHCLS